MNSSTLEQYLETGVKAQNMMITSLVWKESLQTKTEQLNSSHFGNALEYLITFCGLEKTDWNHSSSFAQYLLGVISPNIFPSAGILFLLSHLVQVYLQHGLLRPVATAGPGVLIQAGSVAVLDDVGALLGETAVLLVGVVSCRVVTKILIALKHEALKPANRLGEVGLLTAARHCFRISV